MVVYGLIVIALGLMFEAEIFASLGADKTLFPVMSEYYRIIFPFLFFQFIVIQIYFFIRLDGFPNLAALGLAIGAAVNITLDYLFIAVYGWGLDWRGAGDGALRGSIPCGDAVLLFSPTAENIFWLAGKKIGARSFRRPTTVSLNLLMKCLAR